MNTQSTRKPFFILNPLSVINQEAVSQNMLTNLMKDYETGGAIPGAKFESAYKSALSNGSLDYAKFKALIRAEYRMFPDTVVEKALKTAMETQMPFGFDKHTIRALRDQGNVSFLLTKQSAPELDQLQKGIIQLLRREFGKDAAELKENDFFFQKKVSENGLTIVTQTDKKPPAQKLLEYADVVQEKGMGFSPKIIGVNADELLQLHQEQKKQAKVGERLNRAGMEMFLVGPKTAEFAVPLPREIQRVSSLKDVLVPRATAEGKPQTQPFI